MNETHLRNIIRRIISENEGGEYGAGGYGGSGLSFDDINTSSGGGADYGSGPRGTLLKIFWKPFADVAQAAKLTAKDVLNGMKLAFDTAFTLSPKKLIAARERYNNRRKKIQSQWAPLLQSSYSAIANSDLGLATLTLAPHLFFGAVIAKGVTQGPSEIADFLSSVGWFPGSWLREIDKEITNSRFYSDKEWNEVRDRMFGGGKAGRSSSESRRQSQGQGGVSAALRSFFFGSSDTSESVTSLLDNLITEAEKGSGQRSGGRLQLNLPPAELEGEAASIIEASIDAKKNQADELINTFVEQISPIKDIIEKSKSYEDLDKIKTLQISSNSSGLDAIKKEIDGMNKSLEEEKNRLQNDKKVDEDIRKEYDKLKEDEKSKTSYEDYKNAAAQEALSQFKNDNFMKLKSTFAQTVKNLAGPTIKKIRSEILSETTPDGRTVPIPENLLNSNSKAAKAYKQIADSVESRILAVTAS